MKVVWEGFLNIGLISIPVKLYEVIIPAVFGFRLLHTRCKTPLTYQRWCEKCKKGVKEKEVVKGYEHNKGSFFIITDKKFEELKPEPTDIVTIQGCVDSTTINPIYIDNHYVVAPAKAKEKSYYVLMQALTEKKCALFGRLIMREKERMCIVQPYEEGMLLTTLHYQNELYDVAHIKELQHPIVELRSEEVALTKELITQLYVKKFTIQKYKDMFGNQLRKRIEQAAQGKKVEKISKPTRKKEKRTLLELLQESLKLVSEK